jgi:hypothetical protein
MITSNVTDQTGTIAQMRSTTANGVNQPVFPIKKALLEYEPLFMRIELDRAGPFVLDRQQLLGSILVGQDQKMRDAKASSRSHREDRQRRESACRGY